MPTIPNNSIRPKTIQGRQIKPKRNAGQYGTAQWKSYSYRLRSQNPKCEMCGKLAAPRELATDHKIPVAYGGSFWNHANHWVLCAPCHNHKTSQERTRPMYESKRDEYGDLIPKD